MDVHDVGDCQLVDSWDMEIRNTFLPQKTVDVISMWEVILSLKTWELEKTSVVSSPRNQR